MITWQMQFTIRQFLSAEKCVLTWAKGWWRIKTWYVVTLPILVTDDRYSLCWWQVQDICDWLYDKVNNITLVTVPCRSSSSRKLFFPTHLNFIQFGYDLEKFRHMIQTKPHLAREIDEKGHDNYPWDVEASDKFSM